MEELIKAAIELNDLLELDPQINIKTDNRQELINCIRQASTLIEERDVFTESTMACLRKQRCQPSFWPKPVVTKPITPAKTYKYPDKQKPGVTKAIIHFFKTEEGILTKSMILNHLMDLFPDRSSKSMKKTIDCLLPTRLNVEKGMNIKRIEEGYVHFDKNDE